MTGHVTLPCEVYIFIFDSAWSMFSSCSGWMQGWHASLVVAGSFLGQVKKFFWLKWLKTFLYI